MRGTIKETAEQLIFSKQRVADHGEVFTPAWLVDAMLDLVKDETDLLTRPKKVALFLRLSREQLYTICPLSIIHSLKALELKPALLANIPGILFLECYQ